MHNYVGVGILVFYNTEPGRTTFSFIQIRNEKRHREKQKAFKVTLPIRLPQSYDPLET